MIEQELGNLLPVERPLATILTMVEVDGDDPAFQNPTKPIGPIYTEDEARTLATDRGWAVALDSGGWRRVVPSPLPKRVFAIRRQGSTWDKAAPMKMQPARSAIGWGKRRHLIRIPL